MSTKCFDSTTISDDCDEIKSNEINVKIDNRNNANDKFDQHSPNINRKSRNNSETNSVNSNHISIVTLDENGDNSSIADSDSDLDDVINSNEIRLNEASNGIVLVNNSSGSGASHSGILCANNNDTKPNIGSIAVQNSSDITFGNKTFYQGPVTIKQFLYDNNKWTPSEEGIDNPGYENTNGSDLKPKSTDAGTKEKEIDEIEPWYINKRRVVFLAVFSAMLMMIITVLLSGKSSPSTVYKNTVGDGDDSRLNIPIDSSIGSDIITDTAGPLRVVSRSEWLAQEPEHELTKLQLPSTRVIIAHTATENCSTQAACVFRVRNIQTYHIESRGWDDIGYNFLVGGDGCVYIGRGWDNQGAHTKGYNTKSICIAFIGTFNKVIPPARQLYAAQKIIEEGVKLHKVDPDYRLYGHRQLIPSESPGLALFEVLKTWKHWSNDIVH